MFKVKAYRKTEGFVRCNRGGVAMTFALSALAIAFAIGAAVDCSIIRNARQRMQDAADSAVLNAATLPGNTPDATRQAMADAVFVNNFNNSDVSVATKVLTNLSDTSTVQLKYAVSGQVKGYFSGLLGKTGYDVAVTADSLSRLQKSEIALVLDSTGSMSLSNKMTNLKSSVDSMLASMVDASGNNTSGTKVAVVPFNTQVRIAPGAGLSYIDYGTEGTSEGCSGLNSYVCSVAWDVADKVCAGATDMTACRATEKGWYTTSTSSGNTYYTVNYHAYEAVSGGYKVYTVTETYYTYTQTTYTAPYTYTDETGTHSVAGGNSTSTVFKYLSQASDAQTAPSLSTYNTTPTGSTAAISSSNMTWNVSNSGGYGASAASTATTTSNGVKRVYSYPAAAATQSNWLGCIIDRTQPYDTQADAPNASVPATLYPARPCTYTSLQPVQGLNDNIGSVRNFVKTLQPGGDTNITIGVQWGMEVLSPSQPFTGGVDFTNDVTHKYMIVVTDGTNTANRWTTSQASVDARTALACTNAKALGITIFVINVVDGNSTLLQNCASKPEYFYNLSNSSQINTALSNVFEAIKKTRLSG